MFRTLVLPVLKAILPLFFLINCASAQCEDVLLLHEEKFKWMRDKDEAALSALLHDSVQYVHSNGWVETKAEVIENIATGYLIYRNVQVNKASCRFEGNAAVVIGDGDFSVSLRDQAIEIPLLYTEVYIWQEGAWRLFSRHACRKN
jgi:hypothetical protein